MAVSVSGQTEGGTAGSEPAPIIHRPAIGATLLDAASGPGPVRLGVQTMRSQSAIATRAVALRVASASKSTHGITKSDPTLPLISPINGVRVSASCADPPPDNPAALKNCASAATPDQLEAVGPPGSAQAVITA